MTPDFANAFHSFTATSRSFTASVVLPHTRHVTRKGKREAFSSISSPACLPHAGEGFNVSLLAIVTHGELTASPLGVPWEA